MAVQLFGITNCDSVKKARSWLNCAAITYEFVDIRKPPLAAEVIAQWYAVLGFALVNTRSATYRQLTAQEQQQLNSGDCLSLLQHYPTLIKRSVLQLDNRYFCGFEAAQYQSIFS